MDSGGDRKVLHNGLQAVAYILSLIWFPLVMTHSLLLTRQNRKPDGPLLPMDSSDMII